MRIPSRRPPSGVWPIYNREDFSKRCRNNAIETRRARSYLRAVGRNRRPVSRRYGPGREKQMKTMLLAGSALATFIAAPAVAQDNPPVDQEGDQVIVVTGSRGAPRSRLDTVAPVDVLTSDALTQQGTTDLAQALSTVAPSSDFPRPSVVDATDSIR